MKLMHFSENQLNVNKKLPRMDKVDNFKIYRSHVWFSIKLFFINPKIYSQMLNDNLGRTFEVTLEGPPDKMIPDGECELKKLLFIF